MSNFFIRFLALWLTIKNLEDCFPVTPFRILHKLTYNSNLGHVWTSDQKINKISYESLVLYWIRVVKFINVV